MCFLISLEDTHQPMIFFAPFNSPKKGTTPCHTLRPSRPAPTTFQKRPGLGSFESDDFSKRLAEGSTKLWGRGLFLGGNESWNVRRFAHLQVESNSIWWNLMNKTLKTYPNAEWGWPIYLHLGSWQKVNVGKYTIHWASGISCVILDGFGPVGLKCFP